MNTSGPERVRVAVVGCGAVTTNFHLPVLAGHDQVAIAALVDPDETRAKHFAALYGVPAVFPSIDAIDRAVADAALIATPAFLHAGGAIDVMRRGLHVLVEKPMALTHRDARQMVDVALEQRLVLTVGLFRRLLPAVRLFRSALDAGQIGDLHSISAEVGDAYTWQLATLAGMRRQEAGGGMLVDMGSHVLDLLLFICNAAPDLVEYTDNADAGVETDCRLDLLLHRDGRVVPCRVELSRTRTLRNSFKAIGSRGTIEWTFGERQQLSLDRDRILADPTTGAARPVAIDARWADEPDQPGYEGFRAQIDDWIGAIRGDHPAHVSGESVLPSVALIEQCYANRKPLDEPWFREGLGGRPAEGSRARRSRVLVTGASGFIGCRLSERLHYGSDWNVRAMIRQPGRAVRLARMPIEFAIADLASPADLARALEGCDAVVHAGIGTSWRESERIATTVKGTRNLVDAAKRAGVKRFIHLSTIALYGDEATGTITEATPLHPKKGWDYAESKLAAEEIVLDAAAHGLDATILRVAVVYGPHNMTITTRPLQHLAENRLVLVDCRDVASNTIYVDNLCEGIRLALDAPKAAPGEIFLMTDDDGFTWGEYFGYFAGRMGATIRCEPRTAAAPTVAAPPFPVRWLRGTRDVVLSSETKALAKRIYNSDPWGTPARWAVDTFPNAVEKLKQIVRPEEAFVYRPNPVASANAEPFTVDPVRARVSSEKARRLLGFEPIVPRARAMELTLAWARDARIVPGMSREEAVTAVR